MGFPLTEKFSWTTLELPPTISGQRASLQDWREQGIDFALTLILKLLTTKCAQRLTVAALFEFAIVSAWQPRWFSPVLQLRVRCATVFIQKLTRTSLV